MSETTEVKVKDILSVSTTEPASTSSPSVKTKKKAAEEPKKIMKSWNTDEVLKELADMQRFGEIVTGVIRGLKEMEFPVQTANGRHLRFTEVLTVALPHGVTGYCPVGEFSSIAYKNYVRFVGRKHNFVIEHLDLDSNVALLSGVKAEKVGVTQFWNQIEEDEREGHVNDRVYSVTVVGRNDAKKLIYVDVAGQSGYIFQSDWAWERDNVMPDSGTVANVQIAKYSKEPAVVRFNRKILLPNPFEYVATLKAGDIVAGKVDGIHDIHGVYVELENGVTLKSSVSRSLEKPTVGEMVTCRVDHIKPRKGGGYQGRVTIIGYPNGKRRARDLGSFLFGQ